MVKQTLFHYFAYVFFFLALALSLKGSFGQGLSTAVNLTGYGQAFESSISRSRYAVVASIVENKTFVLSHDWARFASPDVTQSKGNTISLFPPGLSLIMTPFYWLGSWLNLGQVFSIFPFLLVSLALPYLISKVLMSLSIDRSISLFVGGIFLFATTAYPYATTINQHLFASLFLLIPVWVIVRGVDLQSFVLTVSLLLVSLLIDIPIAVFMLPSILYLFVQLVRKMSLKPFSMHLATFILLALGFAGVSTLLWYNSQVTGSLFTLPQFIGSHAGFFPFVMKKIPYGLYVLLASPERGVLFFAPISMLGLLGLPHMLKQNRSLTLLLMGTSALILFLYASFGDVWGGPSFGPRYLIPVFAISSLFIAFAIDRYRSSPVFTVFLSLLLSYSIVINVLGAAGMIGLPKQIHSGVGLHTSIFSIAKTIITSGFGTGSVIGSWFRIDMFGWFTILLGIVFAGMSSLYGVVMFGRKNVNPAKRNKTIRNTSIPIHSQFRLHIQELGSILFLLIIITFLYGASLRGVDGNVALARANQLTYVTAPFESSHERAPYALILSILRDNKTDLSKDLADFGSPDVGVRDGKFFILFPPGVSFLLIPFYILGDRIGYSQLITYGAVALMGVVNGVLLYCIGRLLLRLPRWVAISSAFVFSFATTSWNYSITIFQHTPSLLFLLISILSAYKFKVSERGRVVWAAITWLCFGLGTLLDFPNAIIQFPVVLYMLYASVKVVKIGRSYKANIAIASAIGILAAFVGIGMQGYYNYVSFGDVKTFGQSLVRFEGDEKYALRLEQEKKDATASASLSTAPKSNGIAGVLRENRTARGFWTLLVANDKGLFYFSPILILSLIGIYLSLRFKTPEIMVLLGVAVANIFVYASFSDPWGGWAFGPRYLVPAMAVFSLFVGIFLLKFPYKFISYPLFVILYCVSCAIALLGVLTTNNIPPKVEADPMQLKYNYSYAVDYLATNKTTNYLYNRFVRQEGVRLDQYYYVLLAVAFLGVLGPLVLSIKKK